MDSFIFIMYEFYKFPVKIRTKNNLAYDCYKCVINQKLILSLIYNLM